MTFKRGMSAHVNCEKKSLYGHRTPGNSFSGERFNSVIMNTFNYKIIF